MLIYAVLELLERFEETVNNVLQVKKFSIKDVWIFVMLDIIGIHQVHANLVSIQINKFSKESA